MVRSSHNVEFQNINVSSNSPPQRTLSTSVWHLTPWTGSHSDAYFKDAEKYARLIRAYCLSKQASTWACDEESPHLPTFICHSLRFPVVTDYIKLRFGSEHASCPQQPSRKKRRHDCWITAFAFADDTVVLGGDLAILHACVFPWMQTLQNEYLHNLAGPNALYSHE